MLAFTFRFKFYIWLKTFVGVSVITAMTGCFSLPGYANSDLMLQPAVQSERASTSLLLDIAKAGTRLVAVGERGHVVYSEDHGKSWTQADVPVSVTLTSVYFPTPEKGWAVGHEGIVLHTTNSGQSWSKQLDGFQAGKLDVSLYKNLVIQKEAELEKAPEEMKESIEQELEDMRYQLEDLQFEMAQGAWKPFLDVWFENDHRGFVLGGFGYIFQTTDGGKTWESIRNRIDNPDTYHLKCIARTNGTLIVAGEVGILYRSNDRGQTWQALASPTEKSFFGLTASANVIAAVSFQGTVFLSKDLGESWQPIKTDIRSTLAEGTVLSDGSIAIVSYGGDLLRINNSDTEISVQNLKYRGLVSVVEAEDGSLVAVGMPGVHRAQMK